MKKHIQVAADIGNGFSKVAIDNQRMEIQPSLVAYINEPLSVQHESQEKVFSHLSENLDITVQSSLSLNGRYLIGKAAQNIHFGQMSFNVNSSADKAHSDITILMTLGMIVLHELTKLDPKEKLPSMIEVNVQKLATALPIIEASNEEHCNQLKNRYLGKTHIITVNNFQTPITFQITFSNVSVTSEGVIGNLGLMLNPETLKYRSKAFFQHLDRCEKGTRINGKDILSIGNVIGIDIGDGTIDISVVGKGLEPLIGENQYIDGGIGNVIDRAIQILRKSGTVLNSRQVFLSQALENNERGTYFRELLKKQMPIIEDQIIEKIKTIYVNLNNDIPLIYFHGAGANLLKELFESEFNKILDTVDRFHLTKVLWLNENESQWLNLDGLQIQLKQLN